MPPHQKENTTMDGIFPSKRQSKESQEMLDSPLPNDKLDLKAVDVAQLSAEFRRLADELVSDDDDLLENCHRLAEKYATLKANKGANNDLLKNCNRLTEIFEANETMKVNQDSQPKAEEDLLLMGTSFSSLNIDKDNSEAFSKAGQRSATNSAVSKIFKDSLKALTLQRERDLLKKENSENNSETNPSKNILSKEINVCKPLGENQAMVPKENQILKQTKTEMEEQQINPNKCLSIEYLQFSSAEKRKVGEYNSNIFNPKEKSNDPCEAMGQPKRNKRNILVDGTNVAFAHTRGACFSSKGLQLCLNSFEKMGHQVKAVVPSFRRNSFRSSDPQLLDELYKEGKIVFTPCKNFQGQETVSSEDRFVLQLAYEWNAAVVSNDTYRNLIDESPAFRRIVATRLGYAWFDDIFIPFGRRGLTLDQILHF